MPVLTDAVADVGGRSEGGGQSERTAQTQEVAAAWVVGSGRTRVARLVLAVPVVPGRTARCREKNEKSISFMHE